MSEPFIGQISIFGFNFAPRGWAFAAGQLEQISQNTALFSLLGTAYGGDGRTTFGLPDLRGRMPRGFGDGPGLGNVVLGEKTGRELVTLLTTNMPMHNHALQPNGIKIEVSQDAGSAIAPSSATPYIAGTPGGPASAQMWSASASNPTGLGGVTASSSAIGETGGSQPFDNMNPYLGLNFSIALMGIFPSRN